MKAEAGAETINLFMDLERIGEHQDSKRAYSIFLSICLKL